MFEEKASKREFDYLESSYKDNRNLVWDQQIKIGAQEERIDRLTTALRLLTDSHYELHHRFNVLLSKLDYTIIKRPELSVIVSTKKLSKVGDMTKLKEWN